MPAERPRIATPWSARKARPTVYRDPEFTPGELLVLISWLPDDSATSASSSGGHHHRGWTEDRWLLKSIFDATQVNGVIAIKVAAGKKAKKVQMPEPWPDPDRRLRMTEQLRPKASVGRMRSHFGTTKS